MEKRMELILSVGFEGGAIRLYGFRRLGDWCFTLERNEAALYGLLDEDDQKSLGPLLVGKSKVVASWEEACKLLAPYSWAISSPMFVHPEFREKVWQEVVKQFEQSVRQAERYGTRSPRLQEWRKKCLPVSKEAVKLANFIKSSKRMVVLTGAGMSTESGIPDFRSSEGRWKNIDPRKVASVEAMRNQYSTFQSFYKKRIEDLQYCSPHYGHKILAQWEKQGRLHSIATQNVDGFHQRAGNQKVYELHGSILTVRCIHCEQEGEPRDFLEGECCRECGDQLRPNVVLFGEQLPQEPWNLALHDIKEADLILVIGSSLEVYPASQLPSLTGGTKVLINMEETNQDRRFDLVIYGKAGEVLQEVDEWLNEEEKFSRRM